MPKCDFNKVAILLPTRYTMSIECMNREDRDQVFKGLKTFYLRNCEFHTDENDFLFIDVIL